MRTVITGSGGQLGQALIPYFPHATFTTRDDLDVANANSCNRFFSTHSVSLILHLAAETGFNASSESYLKNNIIGTANIALCALKQGARLVYCSTDYVFPGTRGGYAESDPVQPVGRYAASKLAGELATQMVPNSLVVRGSWYSRLDFVVGAIDAYTSRIPVDAAAAQIATLAQSTTTGIIHIGGARRSHYEIIAAEFRPNVRPVSRTELNLPYVMPKDVSLDTTRARSLGVR